MSANQSPPNKPKRRYKVKPTEKQLNAVAIAAKHPDKPLSEVMVEAGYSPATSQHPSENFLQATGTMTVVEQFRNLAHKRLNDELILSTLGQMMVATKVTNSYTEPDYEVPDWQARGKAVDLTLKVRGLDTQPSQQTNVQVNFGDLKSKYKKEGE